MSNLRDFPLIVFAASFVVLWLSAQFGATILRGKRDLDQDVRDDFGTILAAVLTLLGLIIGFSFSMAISRYDLRKTYEEAEANAIGTEYVRADLLPVPDRERVRVLLRDYLDQRILFYRSRDATQLQEINTRTLKLQADLWSVVQALAVAQPTPINALVVAGMNDVLNSQGYTQAAWWNRIPRAAWWLMLLIAACGNLLLGYGVRNPKREARLIVVLPLVVAISFLLIADIDSPHGGLIRVHPQNLESLAASLRPH
jgi:hypothetical protein